MESIWALRLASGKGVRGPENIETMFENCYLFTLLPNSGAICE